MDTLHPNASAEGMLAFGEAQVIGHAVVLVYTDKRVIAGRRRNGSRGDGGRATSDDKRAGITPGKKYQVGRDSRPETVCGGDLCCIRADPSQGRRIDDCRRENTRFRYA